MSMARIIDSKNEGIEGIFVKAAELAGKNLHEQNLISISQPIAIPTITYFHIQSLMELAGTDLISVKKTEDGGISFVVNKDGAETVLFEAVNVPIEKATDQEEAAATTEK